MKVIYGKVFHLNFDDMRIVKSTFTLDVFAHILKKLRSGDIPKKPLPEDFAESEFRRLYPHYKHQDGVFMETVDGLIELNLLPITKTGVDLLEHSPYRRDDINHS